MKRERMCSTTSSTSVKEGSTVGHLSLLSPSETLDSLNCVSSKPGQATLGCGDL
jgi:hypothetical protein